MIMADPAEERRKLEQAIAAQETLRATLGDAVVDATIGALQDKLSTLEKPAREERKQVVVLFADVSGFTAMSETMDAEEVRNTMNTLWRRLDAVIVGQGGSVDKHIGDAVMALFGAAAAQEDDPERAVRAALLMQQELAGFGAASGRALRMRVGVHLGPVLLGAVGSNGEFTAMGDTVNLASRLEHAAPVGGVLVSEEVARQLPGDFDARALGPIAVKGKREPIKVFLVERVRPRSFRRRRAPIDSPMIGRAAELKALQDAFTAGRDGEARMVTLVGEAGAGKSRLLYEFDRWCEKLPENPSYFLGRASPQMEKAPYSLLRDLLSLRFGILENDGAVQAREKLERGICGLLPAESGAAEKAHFIGQLIGLDFSSSPYIKGILSDAAQIRDRALTSLVQLFTAACAKQAGLILLEDVHWGDERSLDALAHVFKTAPRLRLCAICVARPALFERRPSWGEGQAYHRRIDLQPLTKAEMRKMLAGLLGNLESIPERLKDLVAEEAEGNPFYIEELVRMLVQDRVLLKEERGWRVAEDRLASAKIPTTLVGILQARLDSLPASERGTLQQAAVIGRTFWEDALARLEGGSAERRGALLDSLRAKEMVFRRESSAFMGTDEYIFKHALLRDVAYESVLRRLRPEYHRKIADWLAETASERMGEYAALIGEHYERAGQGGRAAEFFERAGLQALRVSALREAVSLLQRALELLGPEAAAEGAGRRRALHLELAQALVETGESAKALAHFEKGLELSRDVGDVRAETVALNGLSQAALLLGRYDEARGRAGEALELSRRADDAESGAQALIALSMVARHKNELAEARALLEESLRISQAREDAAAIARGRRLLATVATFQGANAEAKEHLQASLALLRSLGNPRSTAQTLNSLGIVLTQLKEHEQARRCLQESVAINSEIGNRLGLANTLDSLAEFEADLDQGEAARGHTLQALAIGRELGAVPLQLTQLALLARLHAESDRPRALALAGLVMSHPSSSNEGRERARDVLARLAAGSAAAPPAAAMELDDAVRRELSDDKSAQGLV